MVAKPYINTSNKYEAQRASTVDYLYAAKPLEPPPQWLYVMSFLLLGPDSDPPPDGERSQQG